MGVNWVVDKCGVQSGCIQFVIYVANNGYYLFFWNAVAAISGA